MARIAWIDFQSVHDRAAHVVWGMPSEEAQDLRPVAAKLNALIDRQKLPGDYAVAVVRTAGEPRVACVFADAAAAARLAEIVGASAGERGEAWGSERHFTLDAVTLEAIDQSAGTRRRRRPARD
ncbi:MAG: hypothetical protein U1E23_08460 [Reyranellaceae bacterium]